MKFRFGIFVFALILALSFGGVAMSTPLNGCDFVVLFGAGTTQEVRDAISGEEELDRLSTLVALGVAARYNSNPEVINVLLEHIIDDDYRNFSSGKFLISRLLLEAARNNSNPEIIITLIENGADINARDVISGHTPLMSAASGNPNPDIILTLLEMGADPNTLSMFRVYKALNLAQDNEALRDTEALRALETVTKHHDIEAAERYAVEANNVISNFRRLQSASLMFFVDNLDAMQADIPPAAIVIDGNNFALDPEPDLFLLTQYVDSPDAPEWDNHKFKFTGTGPIADRWWWIGLNLNDAGKGANVRYVLNARAEFVNIFGDTDINVAYTNQDVAWMLVRALGAR